MSGEPTTTMWITRQRTTVRHIRGLLEKLEEAEALDYAEVRIMVVNDDFGVVVPGGGVLTQDNLPAEGILIIAEPRE